MIRYLFFLAAFAAALGAGAHGAAINSAGDRSADIHENDIIATRNIRAGVVIMAHDIVEPKTDIALRRAASAIGMEARRNLYKGKPISQADLRPATLIERNAIISMLFEKGALTIETEGRALEDGGMGGRIRVLNLQSKRVVTATVVGVGQVRTN